MLVFNIYVNLLIKYDVSFLVCYDERLSNVVLESGLIGYCYLSFCIFYKNIFKDSL